MRSCTLIGEGTWALAAWALLWLLLFDSPALAEPYGPFHRPQDHWKVFETKHFRIYYTQDTPKAAAEIAAIADRTFERLNAFYHYEPESKITVTLVGYTSYSNGFADASRDRITIFTTPIDFHSRSRVPWLHGVFTHELAHILSLNRALYWSKHVPLVLGTGVARTESAQAMARLPVYGRNLPHWFVEGVAQFDTHALGRDGFDENRRAFQRAVFEDRLFFPLGKLAFFGGEQWYNTGFSFLLYLELRFGEGTVHELFRSAGESYDFVFESLFERALGVPFDELEADFRAEVERQYQEHRAFARQGLYDGEPVSVEGQEVAYHDLTPNQRDYLRESYHGTPLRYLDGKLFYRQGRVIYAGTLSGTQIVKPEALTEGGAIAPHTRNSYFVLRSHGIKPSVLPSIYRPDFESPAVFLVEKEGDERLLLEESRLSDFDVCKERAELAGVHDDGDGSLRLVLYRFERFGTPEVSLPRESLRFPLPHQPLDEVRKPRYGPGCKKLYFSRRVGRDHDLFAYDFATGKVETVSAEPAFELYPAPAENGLYYVSARDGDMNVYYRAYGGGAPIRVTQALTAHHHPVDTPAGIVFSRLYGTGFHLHVQRHDWIAGGGNEARFPKVAQPPSAPAALPAGEDYYAFSPENLVGPTFVPLLDLEYDSERSYGAALQIAGGLELYVEDQLARHALLLRGFAGNRSSALFDYRNAMLPVQVRARAGLTDVRSLYTYRSPPNVYEHVTDSRWGFLYGALAAPLNLYYSLGASAETTRDFGTTTGARDSPFDFADPRYARELYGLVLSYDGIDRRDPTFRERDINKRGYRQFTLAAFYGRDHVHPLLARYDVPTGTTPYFRAEYHHSEYLGLPALLDGFFDHSLQLDLELGYISEDIQYLPFYGGGRLYSLSVPEVNTSVGFVGYSFAAVRGETLANLGISYRGPIARNLGWEWGPFFLEDVYFQLFTSWGNIWSFEADGSRQVPFVERAANGRHVLGDVGVDLRLGHFLHELETNVGTTLRVVYRLIPFRACPDADVNEDRSCLGPDGERGLLFYAMVGGGF